MVCYDRPMSAKGMADALLDASCTWKTLVDWARSHTKMQIWLKGGRFRSRTNYSCNSFEIVQCTLRRMSLWLLSMALMAW